MYFFRYTCNLSDVNIWNEETEVDDLIGDHLDGYSESKVSAVWISDTTDYIPVGIGRKLPELKEFMVNNSKLKLLKRSNFKDMPNLSELTVSKNGLQACPGDILFDLPNLSKFDAADNKLKTLEGYMFQNNPLLRKVNLAANELEFLPEELFNNNKLLEEISFQNNKLATILTDFRNFEDIKIVRLNHNTCIDKDFIQSIDDNWTGFLDILILQCSG